MASGMDAKDAQMENMQQEHSSVQTQLLLCQDSVSQLQSELMQVTLALVCLWFCYIGNPERHHANDTCDKTALLCVYGSAILATLRDTMPMILVTKQQN